MVYGFWGERILSRRLSPHPTLAHMPRVLLLLLLLSLLIVWSCSDGPSSEVVPPSDDTAPAISLSVQFNRVAFGPAPTDYYLHAPPNSNVSPAGVLWLLSGFAQAPESIPPETDLPQRARTAGYHVVLLGNGSHLATTPAVLERLDEAVLHFRENQTSAPGISYAVGGFSAGGTHALRYVEHCRAREATAPVQWDAAFAVDAPVDLFAIRAYFLRERDAGTAAVGIQEAEAALGTLAQNLGTLPADSAAYLAATPFAGHLSVPGNERHLLGTRVRSYHDVDLAWLLNERGRTAAEGNFGPASALILALRRQGHPAADFIQATGRGYRSDGRRHPHSWSIVDTEELIEWLGKD